MARPRVVTFLGFVNPYAVRVISGSDAAGFVRLNTFTNTD